MRITKVTTKKGDQGKTNLADGSTVSKSSLRIRCLGDIDELNSFIGSAAFVNPYPELRQLFDKIQNDLFNLGGELSKPKTNQNILNEKSIEELEAKIDEINKELTPLEEFLLPKGDEFSVRLHIARSVCRRAERSVAELLEKEGGKPSWIAYLNRSSDILFIFVRYHSKILGLQEEQWKYPQ
jgi:cob(I)alamin adenosyltransferase